MSSDWDDDEYEEAMLWDDAFSDDDDEKEEENNNDDDYYTRMLEEDEEEYDYDEETPSQYEELQNSILDVANDQVKHFIFNKRKIDDTLPSEIEVLSELTELILDNDALTALPPEIGKLRNLTLLDLSKNSITALPKEFAQLARLEFLYLNSNRFLKFPHEIVSLRNLFALDLSKNKISALPSNIGNLSSLRALKLEGGEDSNLVSLPNEIGRLKNLAVLLLRDNKLTSLPGQIRQLKKLKTLDLRGNPLPIPPEIIEKINEPRAILGYYFEELKRPLNEIKLIFVGQGAVGKSSIVKRLTQNSFSDLQEKTDGIAIQQMTLDDEGNFGIRVEKRSELRFDNGILRNDTSVNLNIWDFGGQEIMHATHQFFLTKRSLYLLVLDSRLTQEENRVEYWLKIIQSFSDESPVLIVGNKIDQHPLDIDRTGLQKKYPNIVGILETSAATGVGIEALKAAITEQVNNLPHVRDLLPETWFTVKTKLEELGKQSNFITHDKYLELCAENEVSDETSQRTLIGFLHDLGVVLHFQDDPRLEALGILNPQWVTNGVYKILNSHVLFQNKGVLTVSMLDEILNLPEYPRGKRLFIVDMMKKFELCYDIEPDKIFLVPDLLPKDEPAELKFNGVPAFEYVYPVLPSSVITRFIVRMNQKIENYFVWRTGVVLKIGENKALVKADIEDRKITIAIDGLEHTRRDALSAIRYQLDEIHGSIKGLDAQKRVPIPDAPNAEPLDYDYLLQLEQDGFEEHPVKNGNRLVKVNVKKLLSGIVSETERRQSAGNTTNIYIGGDVKGGTIIAGDENEVNR
jgi:internalin A